MQPLVKIGGDMGVHPGHHAIRAIADEVNDADSVVDKTDDDATTRCRTGLLRD